MGDGWGDAVGVGVGVGVTVGVGDDVGVAVGEAVTLGLVVGLGLAVEEALVVGFGGFFGDPAAACWAAEAGTDTAATTATEPRTPVRAMLAMSVVRARPRTCIVGCGPMAFSCPTRRAPATAIPPWCWRPAER